MSVWGEVGLWGFVAWRLGRIWTKWHVRRKEGALAEITLCGMAIPRVREHRDEIVDLGQVCRRCLELLAKEPEEPPTREEQSDA